MKLLLHVCCAPCSVACIRALGDEGIEPVLFWYNPNIHPYTEYLSRRDTLRNYAENLGLSLVMEDLYGLRPFLAGLAGGKNFSPDRRCSFCYRLRLEKTAAAAKEGGFDAFSSTLFISPYQNHELLREEAALAAKTCGVELLYRDFRPLFRSGQGEGRRLGLYMQKYCGCIFSEEERYTRRK
jgi:predicted adenine nucleotide alpha hydrolase (AANH) superfamily ATPase